MIRLRKMVMITGLLAAPLLMSGCTGIIKTKAWQDSGTTLQAGCGDHADAYFLPRRLLKLEVRGHELPGDGVSKSALSVDVLKETFPLADKEINLCLLHDESLTGEDQLGVVTENGLLMRVFSKSVDKSGQIAIKSTEGILEGLLASAGPGNIGRAFTDGLGSSTPQLIASFEFDPFNEKDMRLMNDALFSYGYCVHLDSHDDSYVPAWSPAQCTSPSAQRSVSAKEQIVSDAAPVETAGVLYRPLLNHRLVIMHSADPGATPPDWHVTKTVSVQLPNAAPTFSVGIDRALFSENATELEFDHGSLVDVTISKGSELNEFVTIPLKIAQLAVSLPAQLIQLRIDRTNNEAELLEAQQNELRAIELLQKARDTKDLNQRRQDAGVTEPVDKAQAKQACTTAETSVSPQTTDIEHATCVGFVQGGCNLSVAETCAKNFIETSRNN